MTNYRTYGYDIAVELCEEVVERQINQRLSPDMLMFCSGSHIYEVDETDENITVSGEARFDSVSESISIDLNTPVYNGIQIDIPFHTRVSFDEPVDWPHDEAEFHGQVSITPQIDVLRDGTSRFIVVDFSSLTEDRVQANLEISSGSIWQDHEDAIGNWIEHIILTFIRDLGQIEAHTEPIEVNPSSNGSDPWMPIDMDIRVVGGPTASCIALLFPTHPTTSRNLNDFEGCSCEPGQGLVVVMSNRMMLHRVIGQTIIHALRIMDPSHPTEQAEADDVLDYSSIAAQTTLRNSVSLDHLISNWWFDSVSLQGLTISINEEERIALNARFRIVGRRNGFTADISFEGWMEVEGIDHNEITIRVHIDEPDVTLRAAWWIWLSFGLSTGGVGALLLTIASKVVDPILENFIWGLMGGFASSSMLDVESIEGPDHGPVEFTYTLNIQEELPSLPFEMDIDNIVLDDWALIGTPLISDSAYEFVAPRVEIVGDMTRTGEWSGGLVQYSELAGGSVMVLSDQRAHEGIFRAMPTMMVNPLDFQWRLNDHAIFGDGSITIADATVSYSVEGNKCTLSTEPGNSLETEIFVTAIDRRGFCAEASKWISIMGESLYGGSIKPMDPSDFSFLHQPQHMIIQRDDRTEEDMMMGDYHSMFSEAFMVGMEVDPIKFPFRFTGVKPT